MAESPLLYRVGSALAFGGCSAMTVFVNKILLTNYRFPSFLCVAVGQMIASLLILFFGRQLKIISFPPLDTSIPRKIFPLPLIYFLNLVSGLGGTQKINIPMFTVLRRFSILMTMILEYIVLGVKASYAVKFSVGLMILGSIIAALYDLAFDAYGYTLILINDLCTAANGVYIKKKLDAKDLGKYGLLYYNVLFMIFPAIVLAIGLGDVNEFIYSDRMSIGVAICFFLSCICGFLLNYSIVLCTNYNSALTTTCVGPIKNLFVTYVGMFSSGDYIFSITNFVGINVSVMGSILYTYVTFKTKKETTRHRFIVAIPQETLRHV
ncbi:unnamed protein product [Enterobius vermicularis]|uniref:TPT domain-containing protein n=1 Tax=Enterobius vermicularis TaxID=51028 RepID=A0A0N4UYA8_ENTVE|nr:unnamed protein product [Enterobius vermicularis]